MAIKFNTTEKAARQDTFHVSPADIARGRNSRMIPSADYATKVRDRAISIAESGQIQPAEARRDENNNLVLTLGFTRYDSIELLRKGFEYEGVKYHNPDAKLWIKVVDASPEDAFIRGIIENLERDDTTDLQEALAQQELRETYGYNDTQIAELYGADNTNRVAALAKLLTLSDSIQQKVHTGKLALYTALDTLKLSPEERETVIDGSTNPKGRVEGAVLRKLIRDLGEKKLEQGGETGGKGKSEQDDDDKVPTFKRTVKDFKTFVQNVTDPEDGEGYSDKVVDLLVAMTKWFDGTRNFGDKKLKSLLADL